MGSEVRSRHFRFTRKEEVIAFLERPQSEILPEFRAFVRDSLIPAPRFVVEIMGAAAAAKTSACAELGTRKAPDETGGYPADSSKEAESDNAAKDQAEVAPYEGA